MLSEPTSSPGFADQGNRRRADSTQSVPNLFVIGAMKASTTSFYDLIGCHPEIWLSSEKEPHYFTSPTYGDAKAWSEYCLLFDAAPESAKYLGEASTGYSKLPHFGNTPLRLQETLREYDIQPRFIYLLRDPVDRTVSNYYHSYQMGHYTAGTTLSEAVVRDPILIDASCYARQIRAYHEVFGEDALLIITTSQLHNDPANVMHRVERFLGLSSHAAWETQITPSNSKQALSQSLKLQSLLPAPLFRGLRSALPTPVRGWLKQLAASNAELPPITAADRELVFTRVTNDLHDLIALADKSLASSIAEWTSVKQLGEG